MNISFCPPLPVYNNCSIDNKEVGCVLCCVDNSANDHIRIIGGLDVYVKGDQPKRKDMEKGIKKQFQLYKCRQYDYYM